MIRDLIYVARVIVPLWVHKQRLLLKRRGSFKAYLNLTVRFHEIGQDPYVQAARYKHGR